MNIPTRLGLRECNAIFECERNRTICKGISRNTFYNIPFSSLKPYEQRYLTKYGDTNATRKRLYSLYYGSVTNFLPSQAILMYSIASSKCVLDPCSGWGGRAMGAILYGCKYVGFDTNANLVSAYETLQSQYGGDLSFHVGDSSRSDFSQYSYDTILTSPPYYKREIYPHMPTYESPSHWNNTFLIPMIRNAFTHLQPKGHCFINVPNKIYPVLIEALGRPADFQYEYKKQCRNTTKYTEQIYHWIKS